MKKEIKRFVLDGLYYILGCLLYSSAVTMFISANQISPGGFTGIATVINYIFNIPSGIILFILNIPVLILGFLKFGSIFIVKTAVASTLLSATLTFTDLVLPAFYIDKILASVFGGILMGLGISLVMLRGATTGGVDILAKLINRKLRHFTVGRLILIMDSAVILLATFVYKNIESALYSVVAMYVTSVFMDKVLYGADKGKLIYIVTKLPEKVCEDINLIVRRGATLVSAKGAYTKEEKSLVLCTVRRHEVHAVYEIIEKYDKNAFIVVSDAGEILGEGFKKLSW